MKEQQPPVPQDLVNIAEQRSIVAEADVLDHANRCNFVEAAAVALIVKVAIVASQNLDGQALAGLPSLLCLLVGHRNTDHFDAVLGGCMFGIPPVRREADKQTVEVVGAPSPRHIGFTKAQRAIREQPAYALLS